MEVTSENNRFDRTAPGTSATIFIASKHGHVDPKHRKPAASVFTRMTELQQLIYALSKPRLPEVLAISMLYCQFCQSCCIWLAQNP
jgi:hypothetical protein